MARGAVVLFGALFVSFACVGLASASLAACALDSGGTAIGEAGARDQTSEQPVVEAGSDVADEGDGPTNCVVSCNGACVDDCAGCAAGPFLCFATRACGDCASFGNDKIQCTGCGPGPSPFCAARATSCPSAAGTC